VDYLVATYDLVNFSNFGSLKSTETNIETIARLFADDFSNFGSLKSTETGSPTALHRTALYFSNFGSLKSTETRSCRTGFPIPSRISAISAR